MDGKALSAALSTPPGPWMKDALEVIVAWQLRNPTSTDSSAAIEAVKLHIEDAQASTSSQKRHSIDKGATAAVNGKPEDGGK